MTQIVPLGPAVSSRRLPDMPAIARMIDQKYFQATVPVHRRGNVVVRSASEREKS
jgi:hypothetical protein